MFTPAGDRRPRSRWPWSRPIRLVGFVALLLGLSVEFRRPLFSGNFGEVAPGRVYRSAQPGRGLDATIRGLDLGAILNLRGGSADDAFYRDEFDLADRLGVEFYDLPLSATRRPSRRELLLTLDVLDRCRYPLLIHCKWGSDRTGLVSALYRMAVEGAPPEAAIGEFTLAHGHFPLFGPERLHEPIDEYAAWLRDRGLAHDPARFRLWVEREYRADDPFTDRPTIRPGRRPRLRTASREATSPR